MVSGLVGQKLKERRIKGNIKKMSAQLNEFAIQYTRIYIEILTGYDSFLAF